MPFLIVLLFGLQSVIVAYLGHTNYLKKVNVLIIIEIEIVICNLNSETMLLNVKPLYSQENTDY